MFCRSGDPPGYPYGEKVLFVANDWHAAMVPSYLAARYRYSQVCASATPVSNLGFCGVTTPKLWWPSTSFSCYAHARPVPPKNGKQSILLPHRQETASVQGH